MKTPQQDTRPLHHLDPNIPAIGDNCAQRVPAHVQPCLALGGDCRDQGQGHDVTTTTTTTISCCCGDPHYPHLTSPHNGLITPNGVCPSSGALAMPSGLYPSSKSGVRAASGSEAAASASSTPSSSSASSCNLENCECQPLIRKSLKDSAKSGAENGAAKTNSDESLIAGGNHPDLKNGMVKANSDESASMGEYNLLGLKSSASSDAENRATARNSDEIVSPGCNHLDLKCSTKSDFENGAADRNSDENVLPGCNPLDLNIPTLAVVDCCCDDEESIKSRISLPENSDKESRIVDLDNGPVVADEECVQIGLSPASVLPSSAQESGSSRLGAGECNQDIVQSACALEDEHHQHKEAAILPVNEVILNNESEKVNDVISNSQPGKASDVISNSQSEKSSDITSTSQSENLSDAISNSQSEKIRTTTDVQPEKDSVDKSDHISVNKDTELSNTQTSHIKSKPEDEETHYTPTQDNEHHNHAEGAEEQGAAEEEEEMEEEEEEEEEEEDDVSIDLEDDHPDHKWTYRAPDVDQGWAWVVLVSAFLGMTIFGTFTFSIGIFQAEILQVVEPDIQKTSWVGATHFSTLCMMGPFAGLIKNKLGSRTTVVMSSLIICLGMIGASFSVNVTQLILTYGVITGIGTGMALNPMFVCVSFYFERFRGFASGIISAGAGAGMFVGGPIIRQLIESYGLSGAFLIWGAVGLNIGVAGMVMRPSSLEQKKKKTTTEEEVVVNKIWKMDSAMLASVSTLPSAGGYWGSVMGLSSLMVREKEADSITLQQSQILLDVPELHDAINSCNELSVLAPEMMETAVRSNWWARNVWSSQLSVGDSLDSASSAGKRRYSPFLLQKNGIHKDLERGGKEPDESSFQGVSMSQVPCGRLSSLDVFKIMRNPGFALYVFSASVWVFGESIVYSYLPTYAQNQGSSPFQSAILITALGFTSTFSRLIVGFVAGHPSVGPDLMHAGMLGLCGLFTLTFPLYSSTFTGQMAFASLYGLYSGGLSSVINILIISLIGVEHIALAFGLICFGQGLASLAGPPISGVIVTSGGSYGQVFMFSGALLLLAGCSGFPMVLFKPRPPSDLDPDVDKAGETIPSIRVRMKGDNCHT